MKIDNINIKGHKLSDAFIRHLSNKIKDELSKHDIVISTSIIDNAIQFKSDSEDRYFKSAVTNKLMMAPDDKRVKFLKRNYLNSTRLTKKQSKNVMTCINNTLDTFKLSATVIYNDMVLRDGTNTCGEYTQTTYPVGE